VLLHFGDVGWGEVGASLGSESSLNPGLLYSSASTKGLTRRFVCFLFFSVAVVVGWGAVKYVSPTTNLCIIRAARGAATSMTWAALALLDKVGVSGGRQNHVSGTSHFAVFSLPRIWNVMKNALRAPGTSEHAQIAAVEWNREAIA
jgi:hypothetical protein